MMTPPPLARTQNPARQPTQASRSQPRTDPAPVRAHVTRLLQGGTFQALADAAHVGQMTVWEVARAARPAIRQQTAAALLAVRPADLQPRRTAASGARWRLRSLVAMGHATGRIATALGASPHIIAALIRGERATITTALHHDITRLYDAWWDKQPPRRTPQEKTAACKALQRAARRDWPCPAALDEDELDLPGYQPAARWRYATGTGIAADDPLGTTTTTQHLPGRGGARQAAPRDQDRRRGARARSRAATRRPGRGRQPAVTPQKPLGPRNRKERS